MKPSEVNQLVAVAFDRALLSSLGNQTEDWSLPLFWICLTKLLINLPILWVQNPPVSPTGKRTLGMQRHGLVLEDFCSGHGFAAKKTHRTSIAQRVSRDVGPRSAWISGEVFMVDPVFPGRPVRDHAGLVPDLSSPFSRGGSERSRVGSDPFGFRGRGLGRESCRGLGSRSGLPGDEFA